MNHFKKAFALLFVLSLPAALVSQSLTNCTCWSQYYDSNFNLITKEWHYAVNNGSCLPSGDNVYNFGYSFTYINGEYVSYQSYNNMATAMICDNWI